MIDPHTIGSLLCLIPLAPLLGATYNAFIGRRVAKSMGHLAVHGVACAAVAVSLLVSVAGFACLVSMPVEARELRQTLFSWIHVGSFDVPIELVFDPLSAVMCLVVTGIGLLIHVYSIGYMHDDPGYPRFFCYLNLFLFAMLTLVLGGSLPLVFIGWEGVGLCSFLLIGFWFAESKNAAAATKAFLVNRVGDLGFLAGMVVVFSATLRIGSPTLSFSVLRDLAPRLQDASFLGAAVPVVAAACFFFAATGKSAQIPLFVWLPDAMAGPTPVSALIHAATMVTAGVYLLCRTSFLYVMAPDVGAVVALVAGLTACFAATVALFQHDIKKVLAYSTVSQLGYMFLGCGVGAFGAGLFHVVTHAFFKALLFLGAGSVIHAMGGEQDVRQMGGLRKALPVTTATFLVGILSLGGFPLLAGFFSKDVVLWRVLASGHGFLYGLALLTSALTAFYSIRLAVLTFGGAFRGGHEREHHLHESPRSMTVPLVLLAVGCIVVGWLAGPTWLGLIDRFAAWVEPALAVMPQVHEHVDAEVEERAEIVATCVAVVVGLAGMGGAWVMFGWAPGVARALADRLPVLHGYLAGRYRSVFDDVYDRCIVRPLLAATRALATFDQKVVDGLVNGAAALIRLLSRSSGWFDGTLVDGFFQRCADLARALGRAMASVQNGRIQSYLMTLGWALAVVLLLLEFVR
ncbi:MAG: NADH-quinone oxidoreductase subunit L [Deltaproteobacteria bacterium]|nr:NADH-quinone oxidoreductase subunit L [Deltaproteobacteria bacterium]